MNNQLINKLAKSIHETAVKKGWWVNERNEREIFMLIITELSEAVEADRENRNADLFKFVLYQCAWWKRFLMFISGVSSEEAAAYEYKEAFNKHMKDTVEDELADAFIRCLDYIYWKNGEIRLYTFDDKMLRSTNFAENIFYICKITCYEDISMVACCIMELCDYMDINLEYHVRKKMFYNDLRSYKHGGKKY